MARLIYWPLLAVFAVGCFAPKIKLVDSFPDDGTAGAENGGSSAAGYAGKASATGGGLPMSGNGGVGEAGTGESVAGDTGMTSGGTAGMKGGAGSAGGSAYDCGNGVVETGELCDDGNRLAGDGCSAACTIETGFACSGAPSACNRSCNGAAKTCGPNGDSDCCASNVVSGGTFNRSNDSSYPATVSDFRLDNYEITVGRFRKFWSGYPGNQPTAGSGKNPNNPTDLGWDAAWNTSSLPPTRATLTLNVSCNPTYQTWTAADDNLPMNCIDWFEAEAFCIWDGGRLPTDAELNYAGAAGVKQWAYPWGSTAPSANVGLAVYGCYYPSGTGTCTGVTNIAPVGSIAAGNGFYGQADLAGNLSEWAQDWFPKYVGKCNDCANTVASTGRVLRGGNFLNDATYMHSFPQAGSPPTDHAYYYGARCARSR